jgi:hypothetical protein
MPTSSSLTRHELQGMDHHDPAELVFSEIAG